MTDSQPFGPGFFRRHHGPTWLVAVACYGGWFAVTLFHAAIPLPLLALLGGTLVAWQGSLQHETIHGHPGPRALQWLLGAPPLSLWLPYAIYRESHRQHHATPHLTDPSHDPESPFRSRRDWGALGPGGRAVALAQRTVIGRLLLGPIFTVARFFIGEARRPARPGVWALHALTVALVLAWLHHVHLPLWKYVALFVYPGTSLTLLRSLAEHRADVVRDRRTTVIETGLFFRVLFLNNNLHVMHHRAPHLPWFELPALWRRERASFVGQHPDLVRDGYLAIARRHALRPISKVELP